MIHWRKEQRELEDTARDAFYNKLKKETFTEFDVISAVDLIKIASKYNEYAHQMEKALWLRVLQELGKNNPMAATALETNNIEFNRWYA